MPDPVGHDDAVTSLDHLLDRQEILDLQATYCRGVDRLDLDLVRSVYADAGVDHHTGFDGSADELVAWLDRGLRMLDGTRHVLGTHTCEIRGITPPQGPRKK